MKRPNPITRKEIAQLISDSGLPVSYDQVRDNEEKWGLVSCRIVTGTRLLLYDPEKVRGALIRLGLIVGSPTPR
jgi:hypothetical protein